VIDQIFAGIATGFAQQFGGPFADAVAVFPGVPGKDDGGRIVTPATPISRPCKAQVCAPSEAMRADAGFIQTDMRLIVLTATIDVPLDTSADVVISTGPHAGRWDLQSATLDTAGIGWVCHGRKL
jgi:hypothetical protein